MKVSVHQQPVDHKILKITCTEKGGLLPLPFSFDFAHEYTEYNQLSQEEFESNVIDQNIIIIGDLKVNEKVLKNNPYLKLLALTTTGYDHVDIELLKSNGIQVCNIRGYAGDAVSEHAFMLMINLMKNFNQQQQAVHSGEWSRGASAFYLAAPVKELKNKTLVILGKGEIGLSLAEKATAFGMKIIYSERRSAMTCREGYIPFDTAISEADFLSLHCELNDQTREIINHYVFDKMKHGSYLINVSRGNLVNNIDLINALNSGKLAGYAADVLDQEPPPENHPLLTLKHPNIIITAHIGWATNEAQQRLFKIIEDNINKNIAGIPQNLV